MTRYQNTSTAIVWFRCDLRLEDNPALLVASQRHEYVVPVYIHSPSNRSPWSNGDASHWWLQSSLATLSDTLSELGSPMRFCQGQPATELLTIAGETAACAVYWNRRYEPGEAEQDRLVSQSLRDSGIHTETYGANLLLEPSDVKTVNGCGYRVFSPFWKRAAEMLKSDGYRSRPLPSPVPWKRAPDAVERFHTLVTPTLFRKEKWHRKLKQHWKPGAVAAQELLDRFVRYNLVDYPHQRDQLAAGATSRLSPYLHFGEISPRQILWRLKPFLAQKQGAPTRTAAECYLRQLGWREFAHHLLYHYPQLPEYPLRSDFSYFPWRPPGDYMDDLHAWKAGRTGIPMVDAAMRELWQTGWMHNRARMVVSCFLTKNLLIPWQEGARWFWDTLVDADLANNTVGWQWSAGCGPDALPYFRIFNPVTQARRFDQDGRYVRRWVPELAPTAGRAIFTPWDTDTPPRGYPKPIVDLAASRRRALAAYTEFKQNQASRSPGP